MRIRFAIPGHIAGSEVLDAALEVSTRANEALASRGMLPSLDDSIRRGLRWKPEPFADGEHFDLPPEILPRGWADCDDLAPWEAAEWRAQGVPARAIVIPSGPGRWHALVEMPDGSRRDPSLRAGMPSKRNPPGVHGMTYEPLAAEGRHAVAIVPLQHGGRAGWLARADLPYHDVHVASVGWAPRPQDAMREALGGYALVGEGNEDCLDESIGLWGIPGTASVSFRDVVSAGVFAGAMVESGGNPVAAEAARRAALWAYDSADDAMNKGKDVPLVDQLLAKAIQQAQAGQGLVIIRADGTKEIRMANGIAVHVDAAGHWTAQPPAYKPPPPPPPPPGQTRQVPNGRPRVPPPGFRSWPEFRTAAASRGETQDPGAPPAGYTLWGEWFAASGDDPPEWIYPYLTAEQLMMDELGYPMVNPELPTGNEGGSRPAPISGVIIGQMRAALSLPGPAGPTRVAFDECNETGLCWTRGGQGPVLLRV